MQCNCPCDNKLNYSNTTLSSQGHIYIDRIQVPGRPTTYLLDLYPSQLVKVGNERIQEAVIDIINLEVYPEGLKEAAVVLLFKKPYLDLLDPSNYIQF